MREDEEETPTRWWRYQIKVRWSLRTWSMKLPSSVNIDSCLPTVTGVPVHPSEMLVLVYSFGVGFESAFQNCQPGISHPLGFRAF